MSITTICKQTLTIYKSTVKAGAMGGELRYYSIRQDANGNDLSGIPVSIQNSSARVMEQFSRRGITIVNTIYTETDISDSKQGDLGIDQDGIGYVIKYVSDMAAQNRCWAGYVDVMPPATLRAITSVTDDGQSHSGVNVAFSLPVDASLVDPKQLTIGAFTGNDTAVVTQVDSSTVNIVSTDWDVDPAGNPWSSTYLFYPTCLSSSGTVS